jgi:hypothetical protein
MLPFFLWDDSSGMGLHGASLVFENFRVKSDNLKILTEQTY